MSSIKCFISFMVFLNVRALPIQIGHNDASNEIDYSSNHNLFKIKSSVPYQHRQAIEFRLPSPYLRKRTKNPEPSSQIYFPDQSQANFGDNRAALRSAPFEQREDSIADRNLDASMPKFFPSAAEPRPNLRTKYDKSPIIFASSSENEDLSRIGAKKPTEKETSTPIFQWLKEKLELERRTLEATLDAFSVGKSEAEREALRFAYLSLFQTPNLRSGPCPEGRRKNQHGRCVKPLQISSRIRFQS